LRLFSFGGYGLAIAAMALVVFGAYNSCPKISFVVPNFVSVNHFCGIFLLLGQE